MRERFPKSAEIASAKALLRLRSMLPSAIRRSSRSLPLGAPSRLCAARWSSSKRAASVDASVMAGGKYASGLRSSVGVGAFSIGGHARPDSREGCMKSVWASGVKRLVPLAVAGLLLSGCDNATTPAASGAPLSVPDKSVALCMDPIAREVAFTAPDAKDILQVLAL